MISRVNKPQNILKQKFERNDSQQSFTTSSSKKQEKTLQSSTRIIARKTCFGPIEIRNFECILPLTEFNECSIKNNFDHSKFENNQNSESTRKKRVRTSIAPPKICVCCGWNFPEDLLPSEINSHVNLCIDGMGEISKVNLLEQLGQTGKSKQIKF